MLIFIQYLVDFNSYLVDLIHFLIVLNPISRRFLQKKRVKNNKNILIHISKIFGTMANK